MILRRMRHWRIINGYIFREMLPPFALCLVFFSFVFLMTEVLNITEMIIDAQIGFRAVGLLLLYALPYFLVFVIPMAVMLAVLLTFLRLSSDNEIVAFRAHGVSLADLVPPVLVFSTLGCALCAFMIVYGMPRASSAAAQFLQQMPSVNLKFGITPRQFNDRFKDVTLYVNEVNAASGELIDLFIEDERVHDLVSTIVAPSGRLRGDIHQRRFQLVLHNGIINQVNMTEGKVQATRFDTYALNLDLSSASQNSKKSKRATEMTLAELKAAMGRTPPQETAYHELQMEWHRKFSFPFACIVLGLLAVPLGLASRYGRKSYGFVLGLGAFLAYYIIFSIGRAYGASGDLPAWLAMWAPTIVMGGAAFYLYRRNR